MASEGHLKRFPRSDGKRGWLYQYHENRACGGHLHLKCAECGCLLHLECGMSKQLLAHIETTHGFHVDNSATVLYGICQNCQEGKKSSEIYN
jgi:Fur family ferric uptake transcriptional regulator